jgi:prepilin-type N-terminal cleavage/methylation domain-containing protein
MMRFKAQLRPLADERGMTLIEVVVATLILALAALATFGILASATRNAQRAKASQVTLDLAQEEIERLRGVPYDELAITSLPTHATNSLNPNYRVQAGNFALRRNPVSEQAPLVVNEEIGFSRQSEFTSGNPNSGGVTGTIYRYVVWRNDPSCPETQCKGQQDYKQVVVAVQSKSLTSAERGYVEVQAKRIDPAALNEPAPTGEGGPGGDPGDGLTAQQFYLSDTPCSASGTTVRQSIVSDHLLHNTLGSCASGLQTGGAVPGAPDSLQVLAPPDPEPENALNPAFFDYSDDPYLEPNPDTDKGLQIPHDDSEGCNYNPTGNAAPETQVHRWVTDTMAKAFVMSGEVTLEFYTRTLNDAIHHGRLCIYLFERIESGSNPVDEFLTDDQGRTYWTYEPGDGVGFWPRNKWTKIRRPIELGGTHTIQPGNRLGVALSVDYAGTDGFALGFMYDHPNYPTRLEVETPASSGGG